MSPTTLSAALTAVLAAAALPAAANPLAPLYALSGQVRAQMTVVRAQSEVAFDGLPRGRLIADDVYDELDDLCRRLDRFEEQIARPIVSRHQLRRLERLAHRLDDQAVKVAKAVHEAIDDAQRRGPTTTAFLPTQSPIGYPGITTHTVGHRGIRLVLAGGRFSLNLGDPSPRPHRVARPVLVNQVGLPAPQAAALCSQADALRVMTKQLLAVVCH